MAAAQPTEIVKNAENERTLTTAQKVPARKHCACGCWASPPVPSSTPLQALVIPEKLRELAMPAFESNVMKILETRFLLKGDDGESPAESIPEMFWRVALCVAGGERAAGATDETVVSTAERFFTAMSSLRFLPNSPAFTGAGTAYGQLAACFVLPVDDDLGRDSSEGIFCTLRNAALIQQSGGGLGFSFSRLRPRGAIVKSTKGKSSGPISFLKMYNEAFGAIAQGGTRRGANMAVMRVDHPDILDFVACKNAEKALCNFNISVGITDDFMRAVRSSSDFSLVDPSSGRSCGSVSAAQLFDAIAARAHSNGEPGMLFLDTANRANPVPRRYTLEATNPCGEQFLGPYENCCLASVNLARHISAVPPGSRASMDWEGLAETVCLTTRFLDDVIDANRYVPAVPQLRRAAHDVRRIGLGIMGLADAMYALRVRYGARDSVEFAGQVMEFVRYHCMSESVRLAKERGPFPAIAESVFAPDCFEWEAPGESFSMDFGRPAVDWAQLTRDIRQHGIRNAAHTTIAPTGTIGTIAGCEGGGCEPVFALAYTRTVRNHSGDGTFKLECFSPLFQRALAESHVEGEKLRDILRAVQERGSCQGIADVPEDIRRVFVVSQDITPDEHVSVQAALQRFVDNSISKTCNFPAGASVEDVKRVYMKSWELGCKGLTVYVAGSRQSEVLETAATAAVKTASLPTSPAATSVSATSVPATSVPATSAKNASSVRVANSNTFPAAAVPSANVTDQNFAEHRTAVFPSASASLAVIPSGKEAHSARAVRNERFLAKRPRPISLSGVTHRCNSPVGTAYVTINSTSDGEPFEVFLTVGKGGSDIAAISEALGRLISCVLRLPCPLTPSERMEMVVRQLEGIGGRSQIGYGPKKIRSLPDAIARALLDHTTSHSERPDPPASEISKADGRPDGVKDEVVIRNALRGDICPGCGDATLLHTEGCRKCMSCGHSEC